MKQTVNMKTKKGEITTSQLIFLILLILGFAIVLIFILSYPWNSGIDKEACHEQIVMRSSVNFKYINLGDKLISLDKCGTEKICLSMSGKDCEDFGPSTKEDRITKISIKNENDVKIAIANALYDCNSLLGAGKLNFLPNKFSGEKYCLPCARIAFDSEAKEKLNKINYYDFYRTMYSIKDSNGMSYLEAVYPGFSSYEYSLQIFEEYRKSNPSFKLEDWNINIKQPGGFVIIGAMAKSGTIGSWIAAGAAAVGTIAILSGIGAPVGVGLLTISGAAGGAMFYYTSPDKDYNYTAPFIVPYNLKDLSDIKCTNFQWA